MPDSAPNSEMHILQIGVSTGEVGGAPAHWFVERLCTFETSMWHTFPHSTRPIWFIFFSSIAEVLERYWVMRVVAKDGVPVACLCHVLIGCFLRVRWHSAHTWVCAVTVNVWFRLNLMSDFFFPFTSKTNTICKKCAQNVKQFGTVSGSACTLQLHHFSWLWVCSGSSPGMSRARVIPSEPEIWRLTAVTLLWRL